VRFGGRAEQGVRHFAGHHVDFVAAGEGNDDVRLCGARSLEHGGKGSVAGDGADVEAVLQRPAGVLVCIHDGDFVGFFTRQ